MFDLTESPPRIRGFPHKENYFEDEFHLRDWLDSSLRIDEQGEYWLGEAPGLGELPRGSIVLFYFKNKIVGEALVEQAPEEIDQEKRERDEVSEEFKKYILFVPESIRTYPDRLFISEEEFEEITGKALQHYFEITPEQYLLLMRKLAEKSLATSR